jgi:hypothetical protein
VLAGPRLRNEKGERRSSVSHPEDEGFDWPKAIEVMTKRRGKKRLRSIMVEIKTVMNLRIVRHLTKFGQKSKFFYYQYIM